ncbi:hypothetical protein C8N35_102141 [Breoghania corrubedonensis]|uniref:Uncharacterized protein n=1 Tax=Breoghania corrubedonensis TaxID=665038 RepID=A0A2T5VCG0_9HYPH|nr:hypothetical protein C8N35_102141 [Breoghania corrubedonensis]
MIFKCSWSRRRYRNGYYTAVYTGWFLFGVLPLFISRIERSDI